MKDKTDIFGKIVGYSIVILVYGVVASLIALTFVLVRRSI